MSNETFISYSRTDSIFVDYLYCRLKELDIDPWLDKFDIPSASRWEQEILVAIQFSHNFVYVISPKAVISPWCDMELNHALALNKRLIPIVIEECNPELIRPSIAELNYIFFNESFEDGFTKLVKLLDSPVGTSLGERLDSQITITDKMGTRTFPLYRNQYQIGRDPKAHFSKAGLFFLKDSRVSRHHTTLIREDNKWKLIDEKSSNGVFIKGKKINPLEKYELNNEDVVTLSPYTQFLYLELNPEYKEVKADDKETYTGEV